ncbi:MAG: PIN domain nuclease [Candidatus Acididesulfobacter diazotrophicus]|jgi:hypothetical protein|uniref:PIN domain nuclease n=1 Tax=Candidatus Acididesulfobacter diazotrophicus TaxID=2597226 RepID=A0A519BJT2_9DELT|nr:MAG: PIN domain nuclease [Candidatus Acididesulfobacter diazotrophicus]
MKDERILIDTSAWIDYFKGQNGQTMNLMDVVLSKNDIYVPKVVIAELLQGCKSEKETSFIEGFLDTFFIIDNSPDTWIKAGRLSFLMKRHGKTVNLTDCYISVIAQENNCIILTLDKHFKDIKKFLEIKLL